MPVPSLATTPNGAPLVCTPWCQPSDVPQAVRDQVDEGLLADAVGVASDVLYALSGRQWRGLCTRTHEVTVGACGCWAPPDRAPRPGWLWLPDFPVTAITAVTVGGEDLDVDGFRVRGGRWAQRVDTTGVSVAWPAGDVTITYSYGQAPPPSARLPAARLAGEIALAFTPSSKGCRLPARVRSIDRQGVSMVVLDPMEFLDKGRTGLPEIDMWLAAVNPHGLTQRARVWSPDLDPTGSPA